MRPTTFLSCSVFFASLAGCAPPAPGGRPPLRPGADRPEVSGPQATLSPGAGAEDAAAPATTSVEVEEDIGPFVAPATGGTLAAWGEVVVAADTRADRLVVVPARDGVDAVRLPRGSRPTQLLVDGDLAWVSLHGEGAVAAVDLAGGETRWIAEACPAPRGLALDEPSGEVIVACASGELVWLAADDGERREVLALGPDLRDVVVQGDTLWVSSFREARVRALVEGEVVATYEPTAVDVGFAGAARHLVPAVAWRMVAHPDGGVLLLHQRGSDTPLDVKPDDVPGEKGNGYGDPVPFDEPLCNPTVHTALTRMELGRDPVSSPGLALPPTVTDLVVADGEPRFLLSSAGLHGSKPWHASVTAFGSEVLGATRPCLEGEPWEELPGARHVAAIARVGETVFAQGLYPLEIFGPAGWMGPTDVPADRDGRIGFELFHTDAGVGIACASCHAEGQDDGRVWDFGSSGVRRTASLAPGLQRTAPYHWNGEHPDFRDLLVDTMVIRMGGILPPMRNIDALAAWIEGVPVVPLGVGDDQAVSRGRALFEDPDVGCATCHVPPTYTNHLTMDVGTGEPFQVPSLRGVGYRAPYLHDGCAATLEERLTRCHTPGHGDLGHLGPTALRDLADFLRTL